jgi:hypothetical protein
MKGTHCESCGMPMHKPSEHGGGFEQNPYCIFCTDEDGNLKSYKEIFGGMVENFFIPQGLSKKEAEAAAQDLMSKMPAWKNRF